MLVQASEAGQLGAPSCCPDRTAKRWALPRRARLETQAASAQAAQSALSCTEGGHHGPGPPPGPGALLPQPREVLLPIGFFSEHNAADSSALFMATCPDSTVPLLELV